MKVYEGANMRNVVLIGHGDAGKTQLVSAMLYTAGATQRLGHVDDGTTVTDYDEEEIARSMSIAIALAYAEWGKTKVNLLDTPGFNMFVHEAKMAMPAAEGAVVVVDGVAGVEVVTERVWQYADDYQLPRIVVASRMDRERADAGRVLESAHRLLRTRRRPGAVAHRQREEPERRGGPGPHEGLHLRDGRQRQGQGRRDSRPT